jgi:hypothetical protein
MGNSNPSAETLISIRVQYKANLNRLLAGNDSADGFTIEDSNEKKLIEEYRCLNDYDKMKLLRLSN